MLKSKETYMPINGKLIQDRSEILALELGMFVVYFSS